MLVQSILRNNIAKNLAQMRQMSVTAVPARTKVSKGEMIVLATAMVIGWSAVPAWCLVNIKNYKHKE